MRRILTVAVVLMLGVSSEALAKGPISVTACGESDCNTREPAASDLVLPSAFVPSGPDAPPLAAPWFDVRFRLFDMSGINDRCQRESPPTLCDPTRRVFVLADGSYVGGDDRTGTFVWHQLNAAQAGAYAHLTQGLEPLPAATLPGLSQPQATAEDESIMPWVAGGAVAAIALGALILSMRRWRGSSSLEGARLQE